MNNNFYNYPRGVVRSPILVLVFSILSCGIYFFYWLYATANELKMYSSRGDINPGLDTLISVLCFPYILYWFYKYSKIVYEEQTKINSFATDNSVINTLLPVFGLAVVSAIIMQSDLNNLWTNQRMY